MNKPMVYICSPLRGDYENNLDNAAAYSSAAFRKGYIPITPHIYFTRFMNDNNEKERSMAMSAGLHLLGMCSELWVFGLDHPSEGMQVEIAEAVRRGIPIKDGMAMIRHDRTMNNTPAGGFVTLKDMFKHANVQIVKVRKEGRTCQTTGTTKAIRILPQAKR